MSKVWLTLVHSTGFRTSYPVGSLSPFELLTAMEYAEQLDLVTNWYLILSENGLSLKSVHVTTPGQLGKAALDLLNSCAAYVDDWEGDDAS